MNDQALRIVIEAKNRAEAELRKARASVEKFGNRAQRAGDKMLRFNKGMKSLTKVAKRAAIGVTALGVSAIALGKKFVDAFAKQEQAMAQVRAGLEATEGTAGRTFQELTKMAADLQKETIFGDEDILMNATAQLLTFTNITEENFDRTQKAALDLATRLDGDLKSASIQLGKALNDPVANLSALSRSGIQFSKEQKEMINDLVESNKLFEAQTIILDELEKQYGGSAAAAANTMSGQLKQMGNTLSDVQEKFGHAILVGLQPFMRRVQEFVSSEKFTDMMDNFAQKIEDFMHNVVEFVTSEGFRDFLGDVWEIMQNLWNFVETFVIPAAKTLFSWLGKLASNTTAFTLALSGLIALKVAATISGITTALGATGLAGAIAPFLGATGLWLAFGAAAEVAFSWIKSDLGSTTRQMETLIEKAKEAKRQMEGGFSNGSGTMNRSGVTATYKDGKWTYSSGAGSAGVQTYRPRYALGGAVTANKEHIVGERGPEIFVPRSNGTIIPNNQIGGRTLNVSIYGNVVNETPEAARAFWERVDRQQSSLINGVAVER